MPGPLSPEGLAKSETPRFSAKLREEGMQRINELFSKWHGANQGRITVFPAAALAETSSPELLQAVRAFAEKHDLGYTIHLSQSRAEVDFMVQAPRHDAAGVSRQARLSRSAPVRRALPICRRRGHRVAGKSGTIVSHQAAWPPIAASFRRFPSCAPPGCPIANGTDNNTNDLFEVMRIALFTERIRRDDRSPACGRSPKTCSKTPRSAARAPSGNRS